MQPSNTQSVKKREPLSWDVVAGIGYSFFLMVVASVAQLVVELFLPKTSFGVFLSPIYALTTHRYVQAIVDVVVYLSAYAYNLRERSSAEKEARISSLSAYCTLSLVFLAILFDFTSVYPVQTRIGAFLLSGVLSGITGATLSWLLGRNFVERKL
ncbi:hypothetical protein B9Q11_04310 [Candidatus Marsarchaeota G2 archaeon ECH_B_SAG-F08]|uniref:Uncharacterized protein n=4 Tax=Candidatus Marsarchaeota TaxID=1978152 RepID=A0A2R6AHA3_9ARCH|nr:MAG: hypothetical protein B9Q01_08015 [Candidatus Marsarchaeota G1 archaeon OSP_D]PSN85737.1 MAG: hypothetical protein B9Q02_05060 [Candidatus Marsarchaeota G1 archaeon BE_D]PSN97364.1 MAG: hypothetical protein B9Q11_04310 [Candidatus Marsarchaeota G2 archaeon ECH_B_SAG-F08]PSO04375.1 MAG: hypothetical protein B9Q13_04740 [Candidatus Marsarchaeota G2 archaeon ECH_B_SAG-G16]